MRKQVIAAAFLLFGSISRAAVWQGKLDLANPDNVGPFIGRELHDGQWKGGPVWTPYGLYRIKDDGSARRCFHAGFSLLTNAEKINATFGPVIGVDVLQWTSAAQLQGIADHAVSFWKPFGLTSITAGVDFFGGWTPIHTSDVHSVSYGFGFKLTGKFGQSAMDFANQIIRAGL